MAKPFITPCVALLSLAVFGTSGQADEPSASSVISRCEVIPLADHQVAFQIDGVEKFRWHFGAEYPRPFFYPFTGPSGAVLTRMGHPGAPNHDHHQSIWFAHNKVNGLDFWGNGKNTSIRQKEWLAYQDGDTEAIMACLCGWYDPAGVEVMQQEIVAAIIPMDGGEYALEIQTTFRPAADEPTVELEQTNFGFLAVRVAKSLSAHFGGGQLTNSEGAEGEKQIFAKQARWMDYSGPVAVGQGAARETVTEGISFHEHANNPRYPTHWHVREDGWMGAAFGLQEGIQVTESQPLTLRYLLHAHAGDYEPTRAVDVHREFGQRPGFVVSKGSKPHYQYEVRRR